VPLELHELNAAVSHLEARMIPSTDEEYATCMDAMGNMLPARPEDGMTWDKRLELYRTALADVPPDLLEQAAMACIKSEKFFPRVADIREKIAAELKTRANMLHRALWLQTNRSKAPDLQPFVPEPEDVRLRAAIERWHKHRDSFLGRTLRLSAIAAEVRLAELEDRAPADWATEQSTRPVPPSVSQPPRPPAPPPTIEGDYERLDEPPPRTGDELEW
jgi:hypothetical protein